MSGQISKAAARELVAMCFASSERACKAREEADDARECLNSWMANAERLEAAAAALEEADNALWAMARAAGIDPGDPEWFEAFRTHDSKRAALIRHGERRAALEFAFGDGPAPATDPDPAAAMVWLCER